MTVTDSERDGYVRTLLVRPYHRIVYGTPDEGYLGEVAELPGCYTSGRTPQEAIENLEEAMVLWFHMCIADGDPIPDPLPQLVLA